MRFATKIINSNQDGIYLDTDDPQEIIFIEYALLPEIIEATLQARRNQ